MYLPCGKHWTGVKKSSQRAHNPWRTCARTYMVYWVCKCRYLVISGFWGHKTVRLGLSEEYRKALVLCCLSELTFSLRIEKGARKGTLS